MLDVNFYSVLEEYINSETDIDFQNLSLFKIYSHAKNSMRKRCDFFKQTLNDMIDTLPLSLYVENVVSNHVIYISNIVQLTVDFRTTEFTDKLHIMMSFRTYKRDPSTGDYVPSDFGATIRFPGDKYDINKNVRLDSNCLETLLKKLYSDKDDDEISAMMLRYQLYDGQI